METQTNSKEWIKIWYSFEYKIKTARFTAFSDNSSGVKVETGELVPGAKGVTGDEVVDRTGDVAGTEEVEARVEAEVKTVSKAKVKTGIEAGVEERVEAKVDAGAEVEVEAKVEARVEAEVEAEVEAGVEAEVEAGISGIRQGQCLRDTILDSPRNLMVHPSVSDCGNINWISFYKQISL